MFIIISIINLAHLIRGVLAAKDVEHAAVGALRAHVQEARGWHNLVRPKL
jgi:hypothetical protein